MPRKKSTAEKTPAEATAPGPAAGVEAAEIRQAVVFRLEAQFYALPIDAVQEIQQIVEFRPVPDSSAALIGMVDVRGTVIPAIDLRLLIGLPAAEHGLETPMILCRAHGRLVALIVDEVEDVVSVPPGCIQEPSKLYTLADRMIGVCRLDVGLVLLLDADRLVPDETLAPLDALAEERADDEA
ncbi:MAG: hypothetical protein Kow0067_03370 [Coriobacteriia bacterium]